MEDLIKALKILLKYENRKYPTSCEHDVLYVVGINPDLVTSEDKEELRRLGFEPTEYGFESFKFGSA